MNTCKFICIFKMKRKELALLERAEGNQSWEKEPGDQRADGPEDEFDPEFWIKVFNPFTPKSDLIDFTLSNARRFYQSKGSERVNSF